jgi:uncharacterized membrane protein
MVPVVITAILLGTKAGTLMGFFAGLFSFLVWTFMPPADSVAFAFVFTPFAEPGNFFSLVICFVPRILTGTFAGLSHKAFKKLFAGKKYLDVLQYGISAVIGSLTNTVLVLVGIMVFFGPGVHGSRRSYLFLRGFTEVNDVDLCHQRFIGSIPGFCVSFGYFPNRSTIIC